MCWCIFSGCCSSQVVRNEQNFATSILDAQFASLLTDSTGALTQIGVVDNRINMFFTYAFTFELLFNAFANWRRLFLNNGWNWLDFVIVSISLIDQALTSIPDWLVKLMRAFRVIRLFGRVKALKTMITAVTASIVPMMNAFVILIILLCICACRRRAARARGRRE